MNTLPTPRTPPRQTESYFHPDVYNVGKKLNLVVRKYGFFTERPDYKFQRSVAFPSIPVNPVPDYIPRRIIVNGNSLVEIVGRISMQPTPLRGSNEDGITRSYDTEYTVVIRVPTLIDLSDPKPILNVPHMKLAQATEDPNMKESVNINQAKPHPTQLYTENSIVRFIETYKPGGGRPDIPRGTRFKILGPPLSMTGKVSSHRLNTQNSGYNIVQVRAKSFELIYQMRDIRHEELSSVSN